MYQKTSNPILSASNFENLSGQMSTSLNGIVNRCLILLALIIFSACFAWNGKYSSIEALASKLTLFAIAGFIISIVTVIKKEWAGYTSPLYAIFEGLVLGSISKIFESQFGGIIFQAILITFGAAVSMLLLYKYNIIRATDKLRAIILTATFAICITYLASFIFSLFGWTSFLHSGGTFGLLFQLFVVSIASLNLILDFDFIAKISNRGLPSYMGWFAAFGLAVTLVWLYIEVLHLLARLRDQ